MRIQPVKKLRGQIQLPGDKSISHRLAMLASVASGTTEIKNYSSSADCHSTLNCLRDLGVRIAQDSGDVRIESCGAASWQTPNAPLEVGNSGSTIRMLSGLLAGQSFTSELQGDASIRRRPMGRIIGPLQQMGGLIEARDGKFPPLKIHGAPLHGIRYSMPLASAQVKTSVLFAALLAEGETEVIEPLPTRNHTEIALRQFGVHLTQAGNVIRINGKQPFRGQSFQVPGDPSSAAFFVGAGLLAPSASIQILAVGMNPTRSAFFDLMRSMGGDLQYQNPRALNGETVADLAVSSSQLEGGVIRPDQVPGLIDELPILGVIGARSRYGLEVRGARELRVKESDRISAITTNLRAMGCQVEEFEDGFKVAGGQQLQGAEIDSFNDHRIAMAFTIAALLAESPSSIDRPDCVRISFPSFFEVLQSLQ